MVAPSFQKFEFIGDVYVSAGKKYIQAKNPKTGTIRQVRWYEDAEYAKLYPEKAQEQGINQLPTHRQALGFRDAGYFGKCFRKKYGMTPKEYRRNKTDIVQNPDDAS